MVNQAQITQHEPKRKRETSQKLKRTNAQQAKLPSPFQEIPEKLRKHFPSQT